MNRMTAGPGRTTASLGWAGAVWWIVCMLVGLPVAASEEMPVPITLQGALLKKALAYDKTLSASGSPEILVVYALDSTADHEEVVSAFTSLSLPARAVVESEVESNLDRARVVYVMPGAASMKRLARERGVLTISGLPELVHDGEVVLAIGLENSSPRIIINRTELRSSGHEFSSKLLQLARLVD